MKQVLSYFLVGCNVTLITTSCNFAYAEKLSPVAVSESSKIISAGSLPVITVTAMKKISFGGPKTIIHQTEMSAFGDQSVNDTLLRNLGSINFNDSKSSRSVFGSYTILINGAPLQNPSQGISPLLESITPNMVESIEIIKQPSVAYSNQNSLGIVNIILKAPTSAKKSTLAKVGYGYIDISNNNEEKSLINLQLNAKNDIYSYAITFNAFMDQIRFNIRTKNKVSNLDQEKIAKPRVIFITSKGEYQLDEQSKLNADVSYRNSMIESYLGDNTQKASTENIVANLQFELKNNDKMHKVRLWSDISDSSLKSITSLINSYSTVKPQSYGLDYDQQRNINSSLLLKLGTSLRNNSINADMDKLKENNIALYTEGTWRFTPKQSLTVGVRDELLDRSGFAEYNNKSLGVIGAYNYQLSSEMQMQINVKKSNIIPTMGQISLISRPSVDEDNGTLNNPEISGNPFLIPEEIKSVDINFGYKTPKFSLELNPFYKDIKNYIENNIVLEKQKYYLRPENQFKAKLTGINVNGKLAIKDPSSDHNFSLTSQLTTNRAVVTNKDMKHYLAYGISPYSFNIGFVHKYLPSQITTGISLSYAPEYTRLVPSDMRYAKKNEQLTQLDLNLTKEISKNTTLAFMIKNILFTNQKSTIQNSLNNSVLEEREISKAPSALLTLETKF